METTENNALSYATMGSAVLNLFFKVLRSTEKPQVETLMSAAWEENPLLTLRAVFHLRDCRGGKGERRVFYECMQWLINSGYSKHVLKNIQHIPFYGTYKDLFSIFNGTMVEIPMLQFYAKTLRDDVDRLDTCMQEDSLCGVGDSEPKTSTVAITLAAKWAPTEGGSIDKKYHSVRKLVKLLNTQYTPSSVKISNSGDYRRYIISPLREHLKIVERNMCSDTWDEINFEHVPSVAMNIYRKAFEKHQETRFKKYLEDVHNGKAKLHADGVSPHKLVNYYRNNSKYDETIELQWKELVKEAREKFASAGASAFPLVDVSGSMMGEPMDVAIALGLLLSEIASEPYRGSMLTFEENPRVFTVDVNKSLQEKVEMISSMHWGGNTNLARAFDLILNTAIQQNVPIAAMPKILYIFSDMQFDSASPSNKTTNYEAIEQKYKLAGYTRPDVVFWNLRGNTVDFPVEQHVPRCALVSGFSQSLLGLFLNCEIISPYAIMLQAINSPRYSRVVLSED